MPEQPPSRVEIVIGVRTLLTVAVFGAIVTLAVLSLGSLLSIFLAAVVALGLDPVVAALVARGWSRGRAAVAVFASLLFAVVALVVLAAAPVWRELREFAAALPGYWSDLTESAIFENLIGGTGAEDRVRGALADLASGLPDAASTLLGAAGGVFGSLLSLVTLGFLALFLLMERPAITTYAFGFTPPAVEARWRPVLEESIGAISSSLLGNVAISLVAGVTTGVTAWAIGLPFPIVLAVIAGLLDLIPQIGATIAAVILVAVALTVSPTAAAIMLVVQLVYQQVENYIVLPIVYRRAVELSAFTVIVAVLIASALLGVVGAILAVPLAAVAKIVLSEAAAPRRARMAAARQIPEAAQSVDA